MPFAAVFSFAIRVTYPAALAQERATALHYAPFHRTLIVTPARELAEQIHETIRALARHMRVRSAAIYGSVSASPQEKALHEGVEILIVTPGRLLNHIDAGLCKLDKIAVLMLDEADDAWRRRGGR